MPVTECTWRSSPNAPGCWDRGGPPQPVRAGGESLPDSGAPGSGDAPEGAWPAARGGVAAGPGTLTPRPGASSPGLGAPPLEAAGPASARSLPVPARAPGSRGSTSVPAHFRLEPAYCARLGIYWSGVVRTARGPHLPGVPPTLLQ